MGILDALLDTAKLYQSGKWYGQAIPGWSKPSRYDGAALRAIRAERGVGRPRLAIEKTPEWLRRQRGWKSYPAYVASWWGRESPNYLEWVMKPRRKQRQPTT